MASSTRFFSRNFFARSRFLLTSAAICLGLPFDYIFLSWIRMVRPSHEPLTHYIPRRKHGQMRLAAWYGICQEAAGGLAGVRLTPLFFCGKLEVQHGKVSSR